MRRQGDVGVVRHDVWLVELDPAVGSEIRKTRPALVISPDEMNRWLRTVLVAPMTTAMKSYPSRITVRFNGKDGQVALDQIRAVDKTRLSARLGRVTDAEAMEVSARLVETFTY